MGNTMKKHEMSIQDELTEFLLYTTPDAGVRVEIFFRDETVWLPQKRLAELFGVDVTTINQHLKNIYKSGELAESATIGNFPIVQKEGQREVHWAVKFYNLDAILSVGYRVNSSQATQFRIWATQVLREYIVKGFAMDDARLKNGRHFGKDYFREMLERVRSIRSSAACISRLRISLRSAAWIMIAVRRFRGISTPLCRTSSILPLRG